MASFICECSVIVTRSSAKAMTEIRSSFTLIPIPHFLNFSIISSNMRLKRSVERGHTCLMPELIWIRPVVFPPTVIHVSPWSENWMYSYYEDLVTWCHYYIYINFQDANYLPISLASHGSPWGLDYFSYKNLRGGGSRFRDIDTWSSCQKNLFSTISCLCQNFIWHIVALMALARSSIVTHNYAASFSIKLVLCETNNIFYLEK